jgi:hypothetical protein
MEGDEGTFVVLFSFFEALPPGGHQIRPRHPDGCPGATSHALSHAPDWWIVGDDPLRWQVAEHA